jgi:membrane complex biogenesis BtpA family protein
MVISPDRPSSLDRLFGVAKPLVGDIHLAPLPGAPRYRKEDMAAIIARAVTDAKVYEKGGMNGVIVENHGDIPFLKPADIGPEIIAAMAVIATAVREAVGIPVGVNLLANAAIGSLAIAKASGARFNEGVIEGESAKALRYRKMIDAEDVAIFADVHVKHGAHAIVGDRSVSEQARDVEFYDADVAIATGNRTGDSVPDEEIAAIRDGARLPIIAGSGVTAANARHVLGKLDGAIVGSSLKLDGVWWNRVELSRVEALVREVEALRAP